MVNPLFKTPRTPIAQFQIAFKLPHLNATFPSTFRIYKNQKHLKKVRAPTRRPTCCCCCCNNEPWGGLRRRKFVHPLTALIFIAKTQLIEHYVLYNSSVNSLHTHTLLLYFFTHTHTMGGLKVKCKTRCLACPDRLKNVKIVEYLGHQRPGRKIQDWVISSHKSKMMVSPCKRLF